MKCEDVYFLDLDQMVRTMSSSEDAENSVEVKHAVSFRKKCFQCEARFFKNAFRDDSQWKKYTKMRCAIAHL